MSIMQEKPAPVGIPPVEGPNVPANVTKDGRDQLGREPPEGAPAESDIDHADVKPPPDGGFGWVQVLVAHLELANTFGYVNSYGLFENYYTQTLNLSLSSVSWTGSVQTFLLLGIGVLSGRIYDAGYFRTLMIVGTVGQLLGVFLTSICTQYWQFFLTQGILGGISAGLLYTPFVANVSTYFSKNRTLALCLMVAGTSTGGVIFPLIAWQLIPKVGFPWTVRVMGFVMLFNAVIVLSLARARLPPRKAGPIIELRAFKELPYVCYCCGTFLMCWTVYIPYNYINHYASAVVGTGNGTGDVLLLILNATGLIGRIFPAFISDAWLGPFFTIAPLAVMSSICYFCWVKVTSLAGLYVFSVIVGVINGGVQGMGMAGLPALTSDTSKMGVRSGMVLSVGSFATLTGPPITGALIQAGGGKYLDMLIWAGCGMMLVACAMICAKLTKDRELAKKTQGDISSD